MLLETKIISEAVEFAEQAVSISNILGMPEKNLLYRANLEKTQLKKVQYLINQSSLFVRKGQSEDALNAIRDANHTAKSTHLNPIIKQANRIMNSIYQKVTSNIIQTGDQAFRVKQWKDAEAYYNHALELIKEPQHADLKLIKLYQKKLSRFFQAWANELRATAKKVLVESNYAKAHEQYSEALSIAKRSKNAKLVQKLEVEFAKIPNS